MSKTLIKGLIERRAERKTELDGLLETAKKENRDKLSEDEQARFDAIEKEIREIDARMTELDEQETRDNQAADPVPPAGRPVSRS